MSATDAHDEHSSFIKTPQQLIVVILLAFLVPIIGIVLLVQLVLSSPSADPNALKPEAIAARIQPVGRVEISAPAAAPGARSGEEIVKAVCGACHLAGVAGAPKIGDKAAWAPRIAQGIDTLVQHAINGYHGPDGNFMPPKGGMPSLTDEQVKNTVHWIVDQAK